MSFVEGTSGSQMKVLLVMTDSFYRNSLALEYLRSYARADPLLKEHIEFKIFVFPPAFDRTTISRDIIFENPDIIGFSTYLWNIANTLKIAQKVKNELRGAKIILGGVEVSYNPQKVVEENLFIDAVIAGEGEIGFKTLLKNFLIGRRFGDNVPGLWTRRDEKIVASASPTYVKILEDIPSPFQIQDFNSSNLNGEILFETYRGCFFKCSYCLYHRHVGDPRFFPLNRVKKDLDTILASPCKSVRIIDSTFNIDAKRTKEILRFLKGTDKRISVEVSAEFFDEEMIELCSQAGIRHMDIGLQSSSSEVLKAINRSWHKREEFQKNIRLLSNHPRISLNLELICGLPKETYDSFKISIDETVEYNPDHISIYGLQILDGSDIKSDCEKYGIKYKGEPPYSIIETKNMSQEDLRNLELLMFANIVLYNTGIARLALRATLIRYKMSPSQVYQAFCDYCLRKERYSTQEMRVISTHYAVGNRFDRSLPENLSLDYLKSVCTDFFSRIAQEQEDCSFKSVYEELVDYGYNLASLDRIEKERELDFIVEKTIPKALCLSEFSLIKSYSKKFFQTLELCGVKVGDSQSFGIAFFVHKQFGATSLAINGPLYQLLSLCDGNHNKEYIISDLISIFEAEKHSPKESIKTAILGTISKLKSIGLLK
jgi:radical SAM superfamily enzyme YgiQ (UPF0313 family)